MSRPPTHCIDWLRYSVPWPDMHYPQPLAAVPVHPVLQVSGESVYPSRGYNAALALNLCRIEWHTKRPEQKTGVTFSGSDIAGCEAGGLSAFDLLAFAYLTPGARISRLDFAVDSYADNASVADFWNEFQAGRVVTSARSARVVEEHNSDPQPGGVPQSVYVGSRTSERMLRVYNKAAEQKSDAGKWVRIELETKGDAANNLAQAMLESGLAPAGKQAIRDFCMCELDWYLDAVNGDSVKIMEVGRKETDTRRWLVQDVLPVLVRELVASKLESSRDLYDAFATALAAWADDFEQLPTRVDKQEAQRAHLALLALIEREEKRALENKERWRINEDWTLSRMD